MNDLSVRNPNQGSKRIADSLLRATGGYTAIFLMPPLQGDTSDAGQLGIDMPTLQSLTISPVTFRKIRAVMPLSGGTQYELLVSATAIEEQVTLQQLSSADALFFLIAGVSVAGLSLTLQTWSSSISLGEALLYRLLLRATTPEAITKQS